MTYKKRTLEKSILQMSQFFPAVLVTGPRQVGKTTILKNCESNSRTYVSLDSLDNRALAQNDPALFLQNFPAPVLIDEIQYAPQLLPYIKIQIDKHQQPGMFWLTGSLQFHLMKNVTESLAGRMGILQLQGLSQTEKDGNRSALPFLPTEQYIIKHRLLMRPRPTLSKCMSAFGKALTPNYILRIIYTGKLFMNPICKHT